MVLGLDHFEVYGYRQADVYAMLKSINETYERWITERPDHWFWVHNRWS